MDVAKSIPPEESIADQKAEHDRDEKFARIAAANRATAEARRASGQPSTVKEIVEHRFASKFAELRAQAVNTSERDEPVLRLLPGEGDVPLVSDSFRRGMVPAKFASVTLESYEPRTREQEAALRMTRHWLSRAMRRESGMLALVGPQGTGKSHLLYGAANALLDAGVRLYARPWYRLADELRYGGEHPVTGKELEAAEVRRSLWAQKLVMLDEVRPTASTAFDDMELTKFACHAWDSSYPMMITSNVNPLADVMGAPAASRFAQVVLTGPDARQT